MGFPVSLCDQCYSPGACCKTIQFIKNDEWLTHWVDDPLWNVRDEPYTQMTDGETPSVLASFREPLLSDETGRQYGYAEFVCTKLLPNGRCGIYQDRPQLCKSFEPGSTELCVHYRGAEGGEDLGEML